MIVRLTIKNFALIRDAEIRFRPGFIAVTGETGTGKSLLAAAVAFLIGGKAAPGVIRDGAQNAVVEGEFRLKTSKETHLIRRELTASGRSRAFYQDSPITLQQLSLQASELIDITAQRSFSHLLEPDRHLDFLDRFACLGDQRDKLADFEVNYLSIERKLNKLERKSRQFQERQDVISFQLSEINEVDPQPDEDDHLKAEIRLLEHFEEFHQIALRFEHLMQSGEKSVEIFLAEGSVLLEDLVKIDSDLKELIGDFSVAKDTLKEIARRISERRHRMVYGAEQLEELRERQHKLAGIIRKYGGNLPAVLTRREALAEELSNADENQHEIKLLKERRTQISGEWIVLARSVGKIRQDTAVKLQTNMKKSLARLGVKDAQFEVRFKMTRDENGLFEADGLHWKLTGRGAEKAEFFLSTNPGIEPKPLAQVASGGELSRLLLALKEIIPSAGDEATIMFDEIDTGVSGRIARLVGIKLKELSGNRQLIAITHLPQIAGLADQHIKVAKKVDGKAMETRMMELNDEERVQELAVLLSGGRVTKAAIEQARNLRESG